MSEEPRDCSGAKNHCLRGNAWLAAGVNAPDDVRSPATAVYPFDGHWYAYNGDKIDGGTIYRTKPATVAEIQHARLVWVLVDKHNEFSDVKSFLPKNEKDALTTRRWSMLSVESVDAKAGTFVSDRQTYKIDAARVGVEAKNPD